MNGRIRLAMLQGNYGIFDKQHSSKQGFSLKSEKLSMIYGSLQLSGIIFCSGYRSYNKGLPNKLGKTVLLLCSGRVRRTLKLKLGHYLSDIFPYCVVLTLLILTVRMKHVTSQSRIMVQLANKQVHKLSANSKTVQWNGISQTIPWCPLRFREGNSWK